MEQVTIYHNPACSKSRGALQILRDRGVPVRVVEYLKDPPDRATLARICDLVGEPAGQLVRQDARFSELGLTAADVASRDAVIDLLERHPELLQRPVVVRDGRAVIARPPERVHDLIG
jgi:arsenate reductase